MKIKNFIEEFSEDQLERIQELNDVGEISAWLLVQEPRGKLSYIDYSESDIF